jgi:hypothetical protein
VRELVGQGRDAGEDDAVTPEPRPPQGPDAGKVTTTERLGRPPRSSGRAAIPGRAPLTQAPRSTAGTVTEVEALAALARSLATSGTPLPAGLQDALTELVALAAADAQAVRELLGHLVELDAPVDLIGELLAAFPPHIAGPALSLTPAHRGTLAAATATALPYGPGARLAAACERRGAAIYRQARLDDGDPDHPAVLAALARRGAGAPLPASQRAAMEARFVTGFDRVRIHTDAVAADACRAIGAAAFTIGEDIFFADGPSAVADELLAHELAHVVQAQQGRTASTGMSRAGDALEREAEHAAAQVAAGHAPDLTGGGRAVSDGLVLRDQQAKERREIIYLLEDWLTASPFSIAKGGAISSQASGASVRVLGPTITATSDVSLTLPDDWKLGSAHVKVGPIQTLLSSSRIGVYQRDGKTVEQEKTMGQVRDAAEGQYTPGDTAFAPVEAPFYSGNPGEGGDPANSKPDVWNGDGAEFGAKVVMRDQPKMSLPKKLPSGEPLVAIKGSDEFNTSAGFKASTGDIIGLAPFEWSLSWDTPVSAEGNAEPDPARDAITTRPTDEAVIENTEDYANLIARQEYDSVEEAMQESAWTLLRMLPKVRARNPRSGGFIAQALSAKNPSFQVTVFPDRGVGQQRIEPGGVGPSVTMVVSGTITKTGPSHTVTARQGTGNAVTMTFNELADASAVTESSCLNVVVHESGHLGGGAAIPFPFTGTGSIGQDEGSEGSYRVKVEPA